MRLTRKQEAAVDFIAANPHATVNEICDAVGISDSYANRTAFLGRLIDRDEVYLVPSDPEKR